MGGLAKSVIVIALLAAAGGGVAAWYKGRAEPSAAYRTVPVRRTDITSTISATGTIVPEDVVDVGTQVNGQVASFGKDADGKPIDYRSVVQEGALLATIDDSLYAADVATSRAQLEQANAQVKVAEANRDQAKAKLEQARRDWDRAEKLGASEALSQADYDAAKSAFEQAVASVAQTEAAITQAKSAISMADASLQRSQRNLTLCTINAPVTGVVIDKRVEIGQTVVASLNAPSLFLLAKDLRKMEVLVQVNEADVGNVKPGQRVTFTSDAFPGQSFRGEVRKIRLNASMTQNVVTYTVEIATDNEDLRLLPYLTASVKFIVARHENVLAVPNAALRWTPRDAAAPSASAASPASGAPRTGTESKPDAKPDVNADAKPDGKPDSQPDSKPEGQADAKPPDSPRSRSGGRPDGAARGSRGGDRAAPTTQTVWILDNGAPRAITVRAGLSDGILTEIASDELADGAEVIVGEQTANTAAAPAGTNPFAPQPFRGGGPRGGR
jgi:HlyD family secretion protein